MHLETVAEFESIIDQVRSQAGGESDPSGNELAIPVPSGQIEHW
jgi:hypothetical protein